MSSLLHQILLRSCANVSKNTIKWAIIKENNQFIINTPSTWSRCFATQCLRSPVKRQIVSQTCSYCTSPGHHDNSNHGKQTTYSSSVNQEEVDKFSAISESWWDRSGEFQALHNMNELRVPLIRDALKRTESKRSQPLAGIKILDVGCGGGILSEPLARLGADVTGIDASPENITIATNHCRHDNRLAAQLHYTCCTVESLVESLGDEEADFDGVVASEILEHVANPQDFISACCRLVKPKGSFFMTTLNQTWLSYYLGVIAAEKVFKLVPDGAHDWNKFIAPDIVTKWLTQDNMQVALLHGMTMNPITQRWCWVQNTSINYAIHALRLQ